MKSTHRDTRGYALKAITCLQIDKTTFSASILSHETTSFISFF